MEATAREVIPAVVVRRVIKAKRNRVFEAWSNPEMMNQWYHPGVGKSVVQTDFRRGGSFSNEMIFDKPDGVKSYMHTGEYLEITPPERLVFTWTSPFVTNSRVTVELRDLGESTELTLTHELLETDESRKSHNEGWEGAILNLANFLE